MTTPRRRWFRFSLRALFALLTVVGCWLGWELNHFRARQAMRVRIEQVGVVADDDPAPIYFETEPALLMDQEYPPRMDQEAVIQKADPFAFFGYRRLFGDRPCNWICFSHGAFNSSEQEQIKKLFPESHVEEAAGKVSRAFP